MTLKVMRPILISDANITASNVALETAWTAGTYTLGNQRRVGERNFEVSAASTTQEPGLAASTDWFDIGPANRYAAFDLQFGADKYRVIETKTINASSITYTLESLTRVTSIAIFGLNATSITIVGTVTTTGDVANVSYTVKDSTSYNGSFARWLFTPQSRERKYLNFDLAIPQGATIELTLTNLYANAEASAITLGVVQNYGTLGTKAVRTLRSRSIKRTEGTLTTLLRRTPAAKTSYPIMLQNFEAAGFWRLVDDMDGEAGIFAGEGANNELASYGFITSAQTTADVRGISSVILEVESL